MQCPVCDRSLSVVRHHRMEFESCSHCNGVWFNRNELADYLHKRANSNIKHFFARKHFYKVGPDIHIKGGGFCPECNQIVEHKALSTSGIKILKCVGCNGIWVRASDLSRLAEWYSNASSFQRLPLYGQEPDAWDSDSDAPLMPALLGLIEDENPTRNFPWATAFIIIINILVFTWYSFFPENAENRMLIPSLLFSEPSSHFFRLFTSMFMHASIMHLLGNMYFLWVFGDNIEDRIGVIKYILLYLICGIVADCTHALMTTAPEIPTLGASGAISGILGGYLFLYPKARISIFTFYYFQTMKFSFPAWFYLGIWFFGQQLLSVAMQVQGVAWYAHIGGFVIGFIIMFLMRILRQL